MNDSMTHSIHFSFISGSFNCLKIISFSKHNSHNISYANVTAILSVYFTWPTVLYMYNGTEWIAYSCAMLLSKNTDKKVTLD